MNKAHLQLLRGNFEKAVSEYLAAFLEMYEWDAHYGYWVADDCTGIYAYGDDYFINVSDIIYIVDNQVKKEDFDEWYKYCVFATEFGQTIPNLSSWLKGCPRLSKREIRHLCELKSNFENAMRECKEKY